MLIAPAALAFYKRPESNIDDFVASNSAGGVSGRVCHNVRMQKGTRRGVTGRPSQGLRAGERVRDYKRFTVRLPDDVRAELDAAAGALRRPGWRVLIDALRAYVGTGTPLSDEERRAVRVVLRLHEK